MGENDTIERYVPVGNASLVDDAPGWGGGEEGGIRCDENNNHNKEVNGDTDSQQQQHQQQQQSSTRTIDSSIHSSSSLPRGPICWKCRGSGTVLTKKKKKNENKGKKRRRNDDSNNNNNNNKADNSGGGSTALGDRKGVINNNNNDDDDDCHDCRVCHGNGYLPAKKQEALARILRDRPGEITRTRKCRLGWEPFGPVPYALQLFQAQAPPQQQQSQSTKMLDHNQLEAIRLVRLAETSNAEIPVHFLDEDEEEDEEEEECDVINNEIETKTKTTCFDKSQPLPIWLPQQGEQLCNLVGSWRILQRVASHRWTTDDLVTSYMAGQCMYNIIRCFGNNNNDDVDDLISSSVQNSNSNNNKRYGSSSRSFKYLDLGCGNGSVLLMTTWQLMLRLQQQQQDTDNSTTNTTTSTTPTKERIRIQCTGIEARKEAVHLARRSIAFNVGEEKQQKQQQQQQDQDQGQSTTVDIQVHHGDFRSTLDKLININNSTSNSATINSTNCKEEEDDEGEMKRQHDQEQKQQQRLYYDLVTGTPPYFRVDFSVNHNKNKNKNKNNNTNGCGGHDDDNNNNNNNNNKSSSSGVVQKAVINEGGMPTCKQSAPARCEFRGGIEAYCIAASKAMHKNSIFCVCENWINNDRVYIGAKEAGLVIVQVLPVKGRLGKPCPLFAVYVMRKKEFFSFVEKTKNNNTSNNGELKVKEREEEEALATGVGPNNHHLQHHHHHQTTTTKILDCLVVRDDQGNWTEGYKKVLEIMSIPVVP